MVLSHSVAYPTSPSLPPPPPPPFHSLPPPPPQEAVQQWDALLEENCQLASANEQYIMKTEELRRLMEGLVVSEDSDFKSLHGGYLE